MNLAAIVLAAGSGTRFGGGKLSAPFKGEPLITHAIRAARDAPVGRVVVVCSDALPIGEWAGLPPVEVRRITSRELATSLKAGIAAVADSEGAFVFLGDMPLIPPDITAELAAALGDNFAAVPQFGTTRGHPVLLSSRAFPLLAGLRGDEGAGKLLKARKDVAIVPCADEGVTLDIDRAEDIARLEKR